MTKKRKVQKKNVKAEAKDSSKFSPGQIKQFALEVKAEFDKIVWPDKKVTLGLTSVVILLAMLISVYLGAVDFVLGKGVTYFLNS